jgi:hypothetical protein
MRKNLYTLIGFLFFMIVLAGCKSAARLYDKGNYDEAVELAVKKLQKKPDNETRALLQDAYRYAVNDHETRIRQLSENTNDLKWEWIYNEYASLQRLYEAVRRSPEAMAVVKASNYTSYLQTYADKAADVRFQRGMMWMDKHDKTSYRYAHSEFEAALRYRPGELAFIEKRNEAFENAVINVMVMPMNNYPYRYSSYNDHEFRNFENDVLRQLQYHTGNRYVRFFNSWDAQSRNLQVDEFIDFRFSTFNLGRVRDENSTREVSKDVVVKETVYRPDSIVKEYKKVFARIITTKRTLRSEGVLLVTIRDADGRRLWSDELRGDHSWQTEFASYTGDERALNESDKALVNRRQQNSPQEDEIMRHIRNEIYNNIAGKLRNYYSRL